MTTNMMRERRRTCLVQSNRMVILSSPKTIYNYRIGLLLFLSLFISLFCVNAEINDPPPLKDSVKTKFNKLLPTFDRARWIDAMKYEVKKLLPTLTLALFTIIPVIGLIILLSKPLFEENKFQKLDDIQRDIEEKSGQTGFTERKATVVTAGGKENEEWMEENAPKLEQAVYPLWHHMSRAFMESTAQRGLFCNMLPLSTEGLPRPKTPLERQREIRKYEREMKANNQAEKNNPEKSEKVTSEDEQCNEEEDWKQEEEGQDWKEAEEGD